MNVYSIASAAAGTVTKPELVQVLKSDGYTLGPGRKQVPSYAPPVDVVARIQALDGVDLAQLDGLNVQGEIKALFIRGRVTGVNRPDGAGGDIIKRNGGAESWLVVKVIEAWPTWTKAAIVRQVD